MTIIKARCRSTLRTFAICTRGIVTEGKLHYACLSRELNVLHTCTSNNGIGQYSRCELAFIISTFLMKREHARDLRKKYIVALIQYNI